MSVSLDQLYEIVRSTQEKTQAPKYVDLSRTRHRNIFVNQLMKKKLEVLRPPGGTYRWDVKVGREQQTKAVGAFDVTNITVKDMNVKANVSMRAVKTPWAYDIMEEDLNGGEEQIVDVIKQREASAYADHIDAIEGYFWADVLDLGENLLPHSLAMVLRPHPLASTAPGLNGGNPTGWSTKQGLDASAVTRWSNWTAGWKDMTDKDKGFIARLNEAIDKTKFMAPVPYPNLTPESDDYVFATNYDTRAKINQWLRRQNDAAIKDMRGGFGDPVLNSTPCQWVEDLDSGTVFGTNPFLGINFSVFKILRAKGWMQKRNVRKAPLQETVVECSVTDMYNIANHDPSRSFCLNYFADLSA